MGDADGPTIEVTSPDDGDVAMAGDEYTVEASACDSNPIPVEVTTRNYNVG